MSYATSCVQTLDYLLRKHDRMLTEALKMPDTLKAFDTRDRQSTTPVTVEEHDRIFWLSHTSGRSDKDIGREFNRSFTVVSRIRRRLHKLYDPVRCEALSKAS